MPDILPDLSYDVKNFHPLRIRAYLQSGVISDQFLPLDGLLYGQAVRNKLGERHVTLPGENMIPQGQNIQLPFRKSLIKDDAWFYKCSFAQWPVHTIEDQQTYNIRIDVQFSDMLSFGSRVGKIDISRGRYKNYHIKVYYRHALYIDWYADGDPAAIEKLLQFCTHLGKKTAQGWGAVLRWQVSEWHEDWSIRGGKENRLMRNVPVRGEGFLYGVRPSYWLPKHQFPCKMPE
jgi:CRISPR type IV-associated protein Csf3